MIKSPKKHILFLFSFMFLALTLLVNFFHTEKTLKDERSCPACHYQNSSLASQTIHFFYHPQIFLIEKIKTFESFNYSSFIPTSFSPRGPPQA
jgi:hypothetical protein